MAHHIKLSFSAISFRHGGADVEGAGKEIDLIFIKNVAMHFHLSGAITVALLTVYLL